VGFDVGWFRRGFRCGWVSPWVGFAVGEFRRGSSLSGAGFRPLG
jgi:hypothetical protein